MNATATPERYTDRYPQRVQTTPTQDLAAEITRLEGRDDLDRLDRMRLDFVTEEFKARKARHLF